MPNRILREGILTSERVNLLTWEEEVFYRRLMSVVDDYGRYSAHVSLLRAALYPLKLDTVRDANLERLLASVEQARLVRVYEVAGKRYVEMLDFKQQTRAKESRYPAPPGPPKGAEDESRAPPRKPPDKPLNGECVADAKQTPSKGEASAPVFVFGDGGEDGGECAARTRGDSPPEPEDPGPPSLAEAVCKAMQGAGFTRADPGDPKLKALLDQGVTLEEMVSAAKRAVAGGRSWAWLLAAVVGRRADAAALDVQETPDAKPLQPKPWHESADGIKAKGLELGMPWSEDGWVNGENMAFPTYKARVMARSAVGGSA